ncbi:MAG: nucleotide exchange factor GrpE [Patescibacteria group bacterium]
MSKKDKKTNNSTFGDKDIELETDEEFAEIEIKDQTAKIKKLKQELKTCLAEKQEFLTGWQRAKADFINLKNDFEKERERAQKLANENILTDLIKLADSFDMALADTNSWQETPENWRTGIEQIHKQLLSVFAQYDLHPIEPQPGDTPDHYRHESVGLEDKEGIKSGQISLLVKKGYCLSDKVIRPAQVKIAN